MYLIALKPSWTVERIQSIFNAFTAATNEAIKDGNSSLIIKCYFRILKHPIFNWVFFSTVLEEGRRPFKSGFSTISIRASERWAFHLSGRVEEILEREIRFIIPCFK